MARHADASAGSSATQFKYLAFLSYRAADARQAAWLHRRLETYVVPRALVRTRGEYGIVPRRLGRIFRDRDEARASERIEKVFAEKLSESQHLIVLCTPNAVTRGSWVLARSRSSANVALTARSMR